MCVCVCVCVCVLVCLLVCLFVCSCSSVRLFVCVFACVIVGCLCGCICLVVCVSVCVFACLFVYLFTDGIVAVLHPCPLSARSVQTCVHVKMSMHPNTCAYTYMYIYIYIYIYITCCFSGFSVEVTTPLHSQRAWRPKESQGPCESSSVAWRKLEISRKSVCVKFYQFLRISWRTGQSTYIYIYVLRRYEKMPARGPQIKFQAIYFTILSSGT